ncbi:hypothetical protein G6F22_018281 [Rhizopus arrhizus]|nr:hypothetical protein G6F22_018281 [Rhizopus arrhizus]
MLVGLYGLTRGDIRFDGQPLSRMSEPGGRALRKRLQMIFQDPYRSLNPRRQVGDSLIEGLVNFGVANAEAREQAAQALELVGLGRDVMQRYPHQFSGGQRQRLCSARAVVMDPDLLVADEAVSALDVSVQDQVLKLLEEIRARTGVAILVITHDLRVAAQICDSIVVMQKGCVVESGPASRVLTAPQQAYTRELIEAAPGRDWDFRNFRALRAA